MVQGSDDEDYSATSFLKYRSQKQEQEKQARVAQGLPEMEPEDDEELRFIKAETRKVKNDSLESTKNSLKLIKEAEDVGWNTLVRLREQTEQLERVEEDMNVADYHAEDSYKSAKDLKKYSGLFPFSFGNLFSGKKKKEGDKEYRKKMTKLEKAELADLKKKEKEAKKLEKQMLKDGIIIEEPVIENKENLNVVQLPKAELSAPELRIRKPTRTTVYEDETEREIDENLEAVVDSVQKLKMMSLTMLDEMEFQDRQIDRISTTGDHVQHLIHRTTRKLGAV